MATSRVTLDSRSLRALAHPLRTRLLGALRAFGPDTATGLAQRLGTNSGATSYHLRQLAEVGLVEEDPDLGRGRERVWRAVHEMTSWRDTDFEDNPDDRAAADWLYGHHLRVTGRWVEDWYEARRDWPEGWRGAADNSDYQLELTARELEELTRELHAVIERYRDRPREDREDEEVQRCLVVLHAFPSPEPRL